MLTTILPFSLWTVPETDRKAFAAQIAQTSLPNLNQWQRRVRCVSRQTWSESALSSPHEMALAQALGWQDVRDGLLPQAAHIAQTLGLRCEADEGWALISWCHWQVSNGQVIVCDPQDLALDEPTNRQLFELVQPFFAEDGVMLFAHRPGHWLAKSKAFLNLPTASLDRVVGRNIHAWMVGGEHPNASAQRLRRLQNEMQMLLYTHDLNAHRTPSINSFWVHGTGNLTAVHASGEHQVHDDWRASALQHDFLSWLQTWQALDARLFAPDATTVQRWVLCGEDALHVYETAQPKLWQTLRHQWSPPRLEDILLTTPLND